MVYLANVASLGGLFTPRAQVTPMKHTTTSGTGQTTPALNGGTKSPLPPVSATNGATSLNPDGDPPFKVDESTPAGPPPTFKITHLELESRLLQSRLLAGLDGSETTESEPDETAPDTAPATPFDSASATDPVKQNPAPKSDATASATAAPYDKTD